MTKLFSQSVSIHRLVHFKLDNSRCTIFNYFNSKQNKNTAKQKTIFKSQEIIMLKVLFGKKSGNFRLSVCMANKIQRARAS